MPKEVESIIFKHKHSWTHYIAVPASLARDSRFPFKPGDKIIIRISGEGLQVEKKEASK